MTIVAVSIKSIFRDRVFQGILVVALILLAVPSVSVLSMRQVTELSITLCLSLVSFILLLLAIFLGGVTLWKDIDRRYAHSVLSLPISRSRYLFGKFTGVALFLLLSTLLLGVVAMLVILFVSNSYPPDRPIAWGTIALALGLDACKCILLVAFALLFSSVSTSFFLPVFGTIAIFLVGGASQQAYDFVNSSAASTISPLVRQVASMLYYVLPNFSAFDLKVNAIYALNLNAQGICLTVVYFIVYTAILLLCSAAAFNRRELG